MKLKSTDKLSVINHCLMVNGKPFVVLKPDEPTWEVVDNTLVTLFRGHLYNHWNPEDIEGYYP